jgi:hypothetical protein
MPKYYLVEEKERNAYSNNIEIDAEQLYELRAKSVIKRREEILLKK